MKLVEKDGKAFVGQWNGTTFNISVPASSYYDMRNTETFLDLPLMDKADLDFFIEALTEIRKLSEA